MSNFSIALAAALDLRGLSQVALATAIGRNSSNVNRICSGKLAPTRDVLRGVCQFFADDTALAYELLVAHLVDEARASGLDVRLLTIRHAGDSEFDFESRAREVDAAHGVYPFPTATPPRARKVARKEPRKSTASSYVKNQGPSGPASPFPHGASQQPVA